MAECRKTKIAIRETKICGEKQKRSEIVSVCLEDHAHHHDRDCHHPGGPDLGRIPRIAAGTERGSPDPVSRTARAANALCLCFCGFPDTLGVFAVLPKSPQYVCVAFKQRSASPQSSANLRKSPQKIIACGTCSNRTCSDKKSDCFR